MCLVMGREPDRHTKIITYIFSMQHTELDCFEILVRVITDLITIDQCKRRIIYDISRHKLMCVCQRNDYVFT